MTDVNKIIKAEFEKRFCQPESSYSDSDIEDFVMEMEQRYGDSFTENPWDWNQELKLQGTACASCVHKAYAWEMYPCDFCVRNPGLNDFFSPEKKELHFPLYGVRRNYQGQMEFRYVYTAEQILAGESEHKYFGLQHGTVSLTKEMLDGFESGFASNDTYMVEILSDQEKLKDFLTMPTESTGLEDPWLGLLDDHFSSVETTDMYDGLEDNQTTLDVLEYFGLEAENLSLRDERYYDLISSGMPAEDFALGWGEDDDARYYTIKAVLEEGCLEYWKKKCGVDSESCLSEEYLFGMYCGYYMEQLYNADGCQKGSEECVRIVEELYALQESLLMETPGSLIKKYAGNLKPEVSENASDSFENDLARGFLAGKILGSTTKANLELAEKAEMFWDMSKNGSDEYAFYGTLLHDVKNDSVKHFSLPVVAMTFQASLLDKDGNVLRHPKETLSVEGQSFSFGGYEVVINGKPVSFDWDAVRYGFTEDGIYGTTGEGLWFDNCHLDDVYDSENWRQGLTRMDLTAKFLSTCEKVSGFNFDTEDEMAAGLLLKELTFHDGSKKEYPVRKEVLEAFNNRTLREIRKEAYKERCIDRRAYALTDMVTRAADSDKEFRFNCASCGHNVVVYDTISKEYYKLEITKLIYNEAGEPVNL